MTRTALVDAVAKTGNGNGNGDAAPVVATRRRGFGAKTEERRTLVMTPMKLETFSVKVRGLTPLIVHNFSQKSKKQMLDEQMRDPSKPKARRQAKDPFADFVGSLYLLPGKTNPKKKLNIGEAWPFLKNTYGIPAIGFKKGMVYAAQRYGMSARDCEAAVWVLGDFVPISYEKLIMREDTVKVGAWNSRTTDLRYRGMFTEWAAEILIEYDADIVNPQTVVNLLNRAGRVAGMCEWRPNSKDNPGTFGRYEVVLGRS